MKKVIIFGAIVFVIIGIAIISRFASKSSQQKEKKELQVFTVKTEMPSFGEIQGELYYTGNVKGISEADVISQTQGVVKKINIEIGERCSAGQVLAVVENFQQEAALEQAKAQLLAAESNYEKAQADLKRIEKLQAGNVATKDNLELSQLNVKSALAQLKGAQAALKVAQKQYDDTFIKATISGYISSKDISLGSTLSPGTKIALISDISRVRILIPVPEMDIVRIKPGKEVSIAIDALPGKTFAGKVNGIAYASEEGMRTYPVEVIINNSSSLEIKSGMFARASIISEKKENALIVPETAIMNNKNGTTKVFTVINGQAVSKDVVVGVRGNGKCEILSGIDQNTKVVTMGKERLTEGQNVKEN